MISKIKNIIIFTVIGASLILVYIFLIKKDPVESNLTSSPVSGIVSENSEMLEQNSLVAKDFLSVLLNVKNIKLDDSIFSDETFTHLHDSSIMLSPSSPGDQGRPNPFAPIGFENAGNIPDAIISTTPPTPETSIQ